MKMKLRVYLYTLIMMLYLFTYPFGLHAPHWFGWERGILETMQEIILIIGAIFALYYAYQARYNSKLYSFWLILAPIWCILCVREMSWGASYLLPPEGFNNELGWIYRSHKLWYKPYLSSLLILIALILLTIFIKMRHHQFLNILWKRREAPITEFFLILIGMLIAMTAEKKMGLSLEFFTLSSPQSQVIEENAELIAYITLFLAQCRIACVLFIERSDNNVMTQYKIYSTIT